jgi:hypothetical protein
LLTLAAVAGAGNLLAGNFGGILFFLGLSATFGALYVLPVSKDRARTRWALIPAIFCLGMAFVVAASLSTIAGAIWPLALILLGLYLLVRPRRQKTPTVAVQKDNVQ